MEQIAHFEGGPIVLREGRWIGGGSALVKFNDGTTMTCHTIDGEVVSLGEIQKISEDIKDRFRRLIERREQLAKIINEG